MGIRVYMEGCYKYGPLGTLNISSNFIGSPARDHEFDNPTTCSTKLIFQMLWKQRFAHPLMPK